MKDMPPQHLNSNNLVDIDPKVRLYLDLDGVVYPIHRLEDSDDQSDIDRLHNLEWWRRSVVERIGSLGVEVVLASSWGESFLKTSRTVASPRTELAATRALATNKSSKREAVLADLANDPASFIWIDDDMTTDMIDYVRDKKPSHTKGLFVRPDSNQGLTNQELDAIEHCFLYNIDQ